MATSFRKTSIKTFPKSGEKITQDTLYWKHLEFPVTQKQHGSVTNIDFCPVEPHHYAITSSTKVCVYSKQSQQVLKSFSRFRETAYSATFRNDGKLLVAGGDEGLVRVFDVGKKTVLRAFKGHKGPVHVSRFLHDNVRVMSGGNDKTVRVWDVPSEAELCCFNEHQDYIRGGAVNKASRDIFITGSYDHTVKLWDTRNASSVLTVDHGAPVECVLMHPGGGIFFSAGGNHIKVWDALSGGRLLSTLTNHHKTVTCMCFCSNNQRLLTGSLDRHVKIHDISSYQVVHTLDYPSSILSLGVAPDDSVIAVGMADGLLSVQKRKDAEEVEQQKLEEKRKKRKQYSSYVQSKSYVPSQDDYVVEHQRKERLSKYDRFFKSFQYSKALDAALDLRVRMMEPQIPVSVMQELIRRNGLKGALAGRDEKSLTHIIRFLQKNISNPKFMGTLIDVATIILDLYSEQIGQSATVDELLVSLKDTIDSEVKYMKNLYELMGTMDTIFAASQLDSQPTDVSSDIDIQPSALALSS